MSLAGQHASKSESIVLLKNFFDDYYQGYEEHGKNYPGYSELVDKEHMWTIP